MMEIQNFKLKKSIKGILLGVFFDMRSLKKL